MATCPHVRPELTPAPACIEMLPKDKRGYPVPAFVKWIDGEPEFRLMDGAFLVKAVKKRLCWVCGQRIFGEESVFVIGPMCSVNRVSSEPPSHRECARWSAVNCPFLSRPHMVRREDELTELGKQNAAGVMLEHNPGVTLLWFTRRFVPRSDGYGGVLFALGRPFKTEWYHQGKAATREQILGGMNIGLPKLREMAEEEGAEATALLESRLAEAMLLVPSV